jgi:hypothetical protein
MIDPIRSQFNVLHPTIRAGLLCFVACSLVIAGGPTAFAQFQIPRLGDPDPFGGPRVIRAQIAEEAVQDEAAEGAAAEGEAKPDEAAKQDNAPEESTADAPPAEELDPRMVRLHLTDGSVVTGNLEVDSVTIETDFGMLTVPIAKILRFRPGLNSYSDMRANLDKMVEELGSDDYNTRQKAHRELTNLGLKIVDILPEYKDGGNAERKRHLEEIKTELREMSDNEDMMEERSYDDRPWIDGDEIVTEAFTVVGKIQQAQFTLDSKYGALKVALNDVSFGDRPVVGRAAISKNITVAGTNMAPSNFKSCGIRVQAGDVVTVRAEGSLTMTPWGSNEISSPNGSTEYGWFENGAIEAGSLVARIGDSGKVFKVGAQKRFVCKTSGTLQLAVGMNPDYSNGYNYPGEYKVRLKVEPK